MEKFINSFILLNKDINIFTVLFGGIIGNERGKHGSQEGLRTHILVCLGAAMTSLVGVYST